MEYKLSMGGLTKNQIQFIENYLVHHKIKYWDVQIELLDHIVCEVEKKMKEGISFESAMEQVHKSFGNKVSFYAWDIGANKSGKSIYEDSRGYKKLLIEKRKHITKKIRRTTLETVKDVLRNYKIVLPFLLCTGILFSFSEYFEIKWIMLGGVILTLIPCIYVWIQQYKRRKNTSLALVVYSSWVGLMLYFPNILTIVEQLDEDFVKTLLYQRIYLGLTLMAVFYTWISLVGYRKFIKQYDKQYQMLTAA
ncbi:hypothetical protein [uncultured Aquimarina sp.]|uniref:hypothetical protein n=2 Tax=uncultured Aquimarina sp. TaxID=575652 RepID=UPI002627CFD5|nr:hypothetical protein [uncultured Aquimarina sp.]